MNITKIFIVIWSVALKPDICLCFGVTFFSCKQYVYGCKKYYAKEILGIQDKKIQKKILVGEEGSKQCWQIKLNKVSEI